MALNKAVMVLSIVMAVFVVGTISFASIQIAGGRPKESKVVVHPPQDTTTDKAANLALRNDLYTTLDETDTTLDETNTTQNKTGLVSAGTRKLGDEIEQSHSNYVSAAPTVFPATQIGQNYSDTSDHVIVDLMPKFSVTPFIESTTAVTAEPVSIRVFLKSLGEPETDTTTSTSQYQTTTTDMQEKEETTLPDDKTYHYDFGSYTLTLGGSSWQSLRSEMASIFGITDTTHETTFESTITDAQTFNPESRIAEEIPDDSGNQLEQWLHGLARRLPGFNKTKQVADSMNIDEQQSIEK